MGRLGVGEHQIPISTSVGRAIMAVYRGSIGATSCADGDGQDRRQRLNALIPVQPCGGRCLGTGPAGGDARTCERLAPSGSVGAARRASPATRHRHLPVPAVTVFLWIVMSAVVAGIVEETSFRDLRDRSSVGTARARILLTGVLFGFAHFGHPEVGLVLLPFYLSVAAVYGALAYFTDSTVPSMILHAGGNSSAPSTSLRAVGPSGS